MPDQRSRRDIKQVHVLVYTTLENPGEQRVQNFFFEDFFAGEFSVSKLTAICQLPPFMNVKEI